MFLKLKITKLCGTVQPRCLQLQYIFSHYWPPLIETLIYSKCERITTIKLKHLSSSLNSYHYVCVWVCVCA